MSSSVNQVSPWETQQGINHIRTIHWVQKHAEWVRKPSPSPGLTYPCQPHSLRAYGSHRHLILRIGIPWEEGSDRMWSSGKGNGKSLQYSCLENPMNSMKGKNDRIPKEELPRSLGAQNATEDQWRNNSKKNEGIKPKKNNTKLWMWLVIEARSSAVKSNIA